MTANTITVPEPPNATARLLPGWLRRSAAEFPLRVPRGGVCDGLAGSTTLRSTTDGRQQALDSQPRWLAATPDPRLPAKTRHGPNASVSGAAPTAAPPPPIARSRVVAWPDKTLFQLGGGATNRNCRPRRRLPRPPIVMRSLRTREAGRVGGGRGFFPTDRIGVSRDPFSAPLPSHRIGASRDLFQQPLPSRHASSWTVAAPPERASCRIAGATEKHSHASSVDPTAVAMARPSRTSPSGERPVVILNRSKSRSGPSYRASQKKYICNMGEKNMFLAGGYH